MSEFKYKIGQLMVYRGYKNELELCKIDDYAKKYPPMYTIRFPYCLMDAHEEKLTPATPADIIRERLKKNG